MKTDECGKPNDEPHPSHRIIPLYTLQLDGPISKTWDSSDNPKGASHIAIIFTIVFQIIPVVMFCYIITHRIHVLTINRPHLC